MEDIFLPSIVTFLKTLSAVTAKVGSGPSAIIRPGQLDESDDLEETAGIVLNIDRLERENDLQGKAGLVTIDLEILCLSPLVTKTWELVKAVRINDTDPGTGLAGYIGLAGTLVISACKTHDDWSPVPEFHGTDQLIHVISSHYDVTYSETT